MTQVRGDFQARLEDSESLRQQELSELQANFERKYQRFKEFQATIASSMLFHFGVAFMETRGPLLASS